MLPMSLVIGFNSSQRVIQSGKVIKRVYPDIVFRTVGKFYNFVAFDQP